MEHNNIMFDIQGIYKKLLQEISTLTDLNSISALLIWDQEVLMPNGGAVARSRVYSAISRVIDLNIKRKSLVDTCTILKSNSKSLSYVQSTCVDRFYKRAKRQWKLPSALISKIAETTSIAQFMWIEAKNENSFKIFEPYLKKIILLKQKEAEKIGYISHPYDALLDEFEADLATADVDTMFDGLLPLLKSCKNKVVHRKTRFSESCLNKSSDKKLSFPKDKQLSFSMEVIKKFGFDYSKGRVDKGNHPATELIHEGDVRIIARADNNTLKTGIFSTFHEAGHAIYYQNIDSKYYNTPLYSGASTAMHEAMARLWENNIGKSLPFWEGQYPYFKEIFINETRKLELHDFVDFINEPSNTPIRIHADEISYVFHIYIRYLIEKKLIEGSLKVSDIPEVWNSFMKEYLNIDITNDTDGCLQDIHWACGLFGYFPTYVIGSIYASQIHYQMKNTITNFDDLLRNSQFEPIIEWLKSNIYCHGALYSSPEIIERITGSKSLDSKYFITDLNTKYNARA